MDGNSHIQQFFTEHILCERLLWGTLWYHSEQGRDDSCLKEHIAWCRASRQTCRDTKWWARRGRSFLLLWQLGRAQQRRIWFSSLWLWASLFGALGLSSDLAGQPVVLVGCEQSECTRRALFSYDTGKTSGGLSYLDSTSAASGRAYQSCPLLPKACGAVGGVHISGTMEHEKKTNMWPDGIEGKGGPRGRSR